MENLFKIIVNFIKKFLTLNKKNNRMPTNSNGKKIAVCFGINDYPGKSNDLRGCVNDVTEWGKLLKNTYGFEVSTILDADVTKDNVKTVLEEVVNISSPGDCLVIQYSGHGTYAADKNGDEIDGKDEALVMHDGLLIDDEINEIMSKIKNGVKVTVIFDSCFSGTATRSMGIQNEKFYRREKYLQPKNYIPINAKSESHMFKPKTEEEMNEVLITGCSDNEVSYDAKFEKNYFGAMTYNAIEILKNTPFITYQEFHKKLRTKLPCQQYPQSPQLEGKDSLKSQIMFV